jgi:large subunit ribosomal protein L6
MSRIGNQPIPVPAKVEVTLAPGAITVKGPLGTLTRSYGSDLSIEKDGDTLVCKAASEDARAMHGTLRALIANMVKGVSTGYEKSMEITGTGYRAAVQGKNLEINLGFSHPVVYPVPEGIKITCERPTAIKVEGVDKRLVGQVASEIRAFRPPEPYKGKGVRYSGERITLKEAKKA